MPYDKNEELPAKVRSSLPPGAQTMYRKAFNGAYDQYSDPDKRRGQSSRDEVAARVAWAAVKNKYEKGSDGDWHRK